MKPINIIIIAISPTANTLSLTDLKSRDLKLSLDRMTFADFNLTRSFGHIKSWTNVNITKSDPLEELSKSLSHYSATLRRGWEDTQLQSHFADLSAIANSQLPIVMDNLRQQASEIEMRKLPSNVLAWVQAYLYQAANHVLWTVSSASVCFPGLVNIPVLNAIGFSPNGPKARKSGLCAPPFVFTNENIVFKAL